MVYSYTPTYYSSLHDTITSICKNILSSSSFRKRGLPAADRKLSKQQSDNLKWQQDSYHRILNLIGLQNQGILQESEVSAFRIQLLETLIASPSASDQEHPTIIRDKLLFLQELLYAKCISVDEYHSSKRPLLQRLAVQGAEIEARDVIVAGPKPLMEKNPEEEEEEWSVINFKDDECCFIGKESSLNSNSKKKSSPNPMKQMIRGGAASMINLIVSNTPVKSSDKNKGKKFEQANQSLGTGNIGSPYFSEINSSTMNQFHGDGGGGGGGAGGDGYFKENPFWNEDTHCSNEKESESRSILMPETREPLTEQVKEKTTFLALFKRVEKSASVDKNKKKKNQLGFDVGYKKWKRGGNWEEGEEEEDEDTAPLTKQTKRKTMHSNDKVLGDNIKKELCRIQTELSSSSTNSSLRFSNDQMEAISIRLPADKADLQKFFPKTWCDRHGDNVLDVVKKEFNEDRRHAGGEMDTTIEKQKHHYHHRLHGHGKGTTSTSTSTTWVATFDDNNNNIDENFHPNLFSFFPPPHHPPSL